MAICGIHRHRDGWTDLSKDTQFSSQHPPSLPSMRVPSWPCPLLSLQTLGLCERSCVGPIQPGQMLKDSGYDWYRFPSTDDMPPNTADWSWLRCPRAASRPVFPSANQALARAQFDRLCSVASPFRPADAALTRPFSVSQSRRSCLSTGLGVSDAFRVCRLASCRESHATYMTSDPGQLFVFISVSASQRRERFTGNIPL
jgi:hypothetical protein